ncbi:hypothetical protein Tco_1169939, partial [Tanacetum coccineum]
CTVSPVLASLLDSGYSLCFYFIMGSITSLKCVLTQEHLNAVCAKYFVPEEVHPQLPSHNATMHERTTGKVGMSAAPVMTEATIVAIPADVSKDKSAPFPCCPFAEMDWNAFIVPPDSRQGGRVVLSASVEREFVGDASVGDGRDQGFDSIAGQDNVEPTVPVTEPVEAEIPRPKRSKKKRVTYDSEGLPTASHPPKRLRADYETTGGSATGGKSPSILNSFGDRTDSVTGPSLRTIGPSARFVVLSDSSHHSGANSADPEVDSLVRSAAPVITEATIVATPADVSKDKSAPHPSVFGSSSSSEKTDRTLSLFAGRSGSGFDAGSIRAEEAMGTGLEETYVPEWMVTKGFELNDGRLCANMIDHFTPPAFFKTVRGMEHEQLFTEFNVSAARNLSLSSEVRMRAEYNISEKRKWRSLAEEKDILLEAKDKEIEDLKSRLLKAKEESAEVSKLRAQVSGLEATENLLRGEIASTKEHNVLLEQECDSLKLKVTGL